MVDATDLKSVFRKEVPVRSRPPVPAFVLKRAWVVKLAEAATFQPSLAPSSGRAFTSKRLYTTNEIRTFYFSWRFGT
jgi:hypothetical protein